MPKVVSPQKPAARPAVAPPSFASILLIEASYRAFQVDGLTIQFHHHCSNEVERKVGSATAGTNTDGDVHQMKRKYLILTLVVLPPLGFFLGCYLDGWRGSLGFGFLFSAGCMFLAPFVVAAVIISTIAKSWIHRALLFLPIVLIQFPLFWLLPAGATATTIGTAHRLRFQFSADQLRAVATSIQQKNLSKTLKTIPVPSDKMNPCANCSVLVDESELPEGLRGRFKCVGLWRSNDNDKPEVRFVLGSREGIVCNSTVFEEDFFHYSIGPYVHAYHYERQ